MTPPRRVSLVIVSRDRGDQLDRCLTAVTQLDHPAFEVVVVADHASLRLVKARGLPVKVALCSEPNIAIARNIGIALAAGEIVAFIDDDAVPEPTWLSRLAAAYDDPEVAAAGGFTRGRNGISMQWTAGTVDRLTTPGPLDVPRGMISKHRGKPGLAIEIKGCNCSYRRDVLVKLGGFDPALAYYLDETELNLRLGLHGMVTAVVPMAQVHHGMAASPHRSTGLRPIDLTAVGMSSALVLRRHGVTEVERATALASLEARQRARLLGLMVDGILEPRDVGRLLRTLNDGWAEGSALSLPPMPSLPVFPSEPFLPFITGPRGGKVLAGRPWQAARLRRAAVDEVDAGRIATVMVFSPTVLPHRMQFRQAGFWEQRGGLFGRSDRGESRLQIWRFASRVRHETRRIAPFRPVGRGMG